MCGYYLSRSIVLGSSVVFGRSHFSSVITQKPYIQQQQQHNREVDDYCLIMTVKYNSGNHWSVLTQLHGSPWYRVLPFCVGNVIWMIALTILDRKYNIHQVEITNLGHSFTTLIVSFLLVSRVTMALNRFNEARSHLGSMLTPTRELITNIYSYTCTQQHAKHKEWRTEVCYRILSLLRCVMGLIDYHERKVPLWQIPELNGAELQYIHQSIMVETPHNTTTKNDNNQNNNNSYNDNCRHHAKNFRHGIRNEADEVYRVPIHLSFLLRQSVLSYQSRVAYLQGVPSLSPSDYSNMQLRSMAKVDDFMTGYYGLTKFMQTPVPFPLIQMARTIAMAYVFTVPLVLVGEKNGSLFYHCISVFILTYGMIGLEMVAIELDDPFGDDPNDFDHMSMAQKAFEDIYILSLNTDGNEYVSKLRVRMHDEYDTTKTVNEQTHLL